LGISRFPWRFPGGLLEEGRLSDASHVFEAHAFHPSLGNEAASGKIIVDRWHFHFQSDAVTLEIPLTRLQVRAGEGADERIYFQDVAQPGWEIITTDYGVLDHPGIAQIGNIREQLSADASRRELGRRLRVLGYVAAGCVLLIWLGQLAVSAMVRSLVAKLPPEVEQQIGEEMIAEVDLRMNLVEDTNRVAKLAMIAAPLVKSIGDGKAAFNFYIAEEEEPNAFALPGGHLVVTTGLLKLADRPEELLGVISHEVAYVTQKHGIRKAIASAGPFLIFRVFLGGDSRGMAGVVGGASDLLIRQSFSQEYETEADDVGWQSLVAARIDPRGMVEMFEKLQAHERQRKRGIALPQAFASHPALQKRIARLEKKWRMLPEKTGFVDLASAQTALKQAAGK